MALAKRPLQLDPQTLTEFTQALHELVGHADSDICMGPTSKYTPMRYDTSHFRGETTLFLRLHHTDDLGPDAASRLNAGASHM